MLMEDPYKKRNDITKLQDNEPMTMEDYILQAISDCIYGAQKAWFAKDKWSVKAYWVKGMIRVDLKNEKWDQPI